MIDEQRLLDTFFDLVRIDSPSFKEADVAEHLKPLLKEMGLKVSMDKAGEACDGNCGNLIAKLKGTAPGEPIAFSAHMDCVPPCCGVEPILDNDVVRSKGDTVLGSDDKAGIAAIIEALRHIQETEALHPDIYLVFSIAEESGMHGAKHLDLSKVGAKQFAILDCSGSVGSVITRSPAKVDVTATFTGRAAHAGFEPEKGLSAITMAADAVLNMKLLRIDEETTANVGSIQGGTAINIVPEECVVHAETRSYDARKLEAQVEHMVDCCRQAAERHGGEVDITTKELYPALNVPEDSPMLARTVKALESLGIKPDMQSSGGGSDANVLTGRGIDAVNLGIGMTGAHTTDEHIAVEDLLGTAMLVAELMKM
ncbi:M20/M25/M40 family metallo-hydrolase [Salidesulfovibrio brasiliensis]|uniref:M20/M25/M40 family metallo-hydrolase n=1 Tax=Salidesulfovibrio brasiliensis TaxID=221711 RepID=UPI0006D16796|nr:M20/M25/M40 family metallo-hydrolase [Salidesulfovibrio brasiliensis]